MVSEPTAKPKLAIYWAASCGGCEISILEIGERILDLAAAVDIVFWPCLMDVKYDDLRAMPDGSIGICLFNGAVRTSEQKELAELLRAKSQVMVAYGSCAHEGCIPALANFSDRDGIFERAYLDNPSTPNPERVLPQRTTVVDGCELHLPEFWDTVCSLEQVVPVDYTVPGCPPTAETTWRAIEALMADPPPPPGSVLGAGDKTVCDECPFDRKDTPITAVHRPHLFQPDLRSGRCLQEQGLVCMGPATRSGCDALCLHAVQGCRGCYGAPDGVIDQGTKMAAALGSVFGGESEADVRGLASQVVDPAGTFYRFGMARALLGRHRGTSSKD